MPTLHLTLSLLLFTSLHHAQGNVIVVDDTSGPGSDFATIPEALDAAASGDIVLVREGAYTLDFPSVIVQGKALTLVGEGVCRVGGGLDVRNLPAGTTFGVRNLESLFTIDAPLSFQGYDNAGSLWIERCATGTTHGGLPTFFDRCSTVVFQDNLLFGSEPRLLSSSLHAYGGNSTAIGFQGDGLWMLDTFAFASGVEFVGAPLSVDLGG